MCLIALPNFTSNFSNSAPLLLLIYLNKIIYIFLLFCVSNTHSLEDEFNLNFLLLSFLFISYLCILFLTSTMVHQLPNISISNGFIIIIVIIIINKTYYHVSSKKTLYY